MLILKYTYRFKQHESRNKLMNKYIINMYIRFIEVEDYIYFFTIY